MQAFAPLSSREWRLPGTFACVGASASEYTFGIPPVCLCRPAVFGHVREMATLSSNSTDAEVWAAYDNNASYEEDVCRAKALAFVTACRILRRRLPLSAGRGPQSVTRESLDAEISAAKAWLDDHRKRNPNVETPMTKERRSSNNP